MCDYASMQKPPVRFEPTTARLLSVSSANQPKEAARPTNAVACNSMCMVTNEIDLAGVFNMTAVGIEPTPLRTGAYDKRLGLLDRTVSPYIAEGSGVFLVDPFVNMQISGDSCGVQTHAFADWRLQPIP